MRRRERDPEAVLIVGLGRFGGSLAATLERLGHEVVAVDRNRRIVQEWSGRLAQVVEADASNDEALRQIGADRFARAVVAIGDGIEASLMVTGVLLDLGVPEVWAKAITFQHGRILERLGAAHVVYPERDAGERVAHLLSGRLLDFIEFDRGFAVAKMPAPPVLCGATMRDVAPRGRYKVTIVGVKSPDGEFTYVGGDTVLDADDLIIVTGRTRDVERFAAGPEPD